MWRMYRPHLTAYAATVALRALLSYPQENASVERREKWPMKGVALWSTPVIRGGGGDY